ncbi:MAG: 5-formyltetrahydrofolate cyclo-ligase [Oceanospirillaceae bacterium]|nr:5-formyltetrahydrofolate cyclo-ligase [Oceanospirillaceae bacterium]
MDARQQLRRSIRTMRNTLSRTQQNFAATALLEQLLPLAAFNQAKSVALYLAVDGEIATTAVIEYCWEMGKAVYLPVLDPNKHNHLLFVVYAKNTKMSLNKYNIEEPAVPFVNCIAAEQLDLVLLPLVAFDDSGARMGMGGGYYDRSFAFTSKTLCHTPLLLGLAHALQQVSKLQVENWDIPLNGIVTDNKFFPID